VSLSLCFPLSLPTQKKCTSTSQNASLPIHHRALRVHLFREQGGKETKSLLLLLLDEDDGRPCRAGNHRDGCGAQSGRAVLSRHQGASMRVTFGLDFFFLSLSFSFSSERERERDERWSRRGTREARARARSATGECLRRRAFFVESARPENLSLSLLGTFFFSLLLLTLFSLS